jgi:hypothetical protein
MGIALLLIGLGYFGVTRFSRGTWLRREEMPRDDAGEEES